MRRYDLTNRARPWDNCLQPKELKRVPGMTQNIQVTVKVGDKQVTLDGPEEFVRSEVQRLTTLIAQPSPSNAPSGDVPGATPASERAFVSHKQPSNHLETVAVLAYLLFKTGKKEFTAEDMKRAYARAGVRPPKVMDQALRDAKNIKDYLEKGSEKGAFRLTPHGVRTVEFDLPKKTKT
jgi:hypothetical protein